MAETLVIPNFSEVNLAEKSEITAAVIAGGSTFVVENAQGLATDDYILLGQKGSETAEIVQVQSISTKTVTITGIFSHNHPKTEPIQKLKANKIRVYRTANVDGTEPGYDDFTTLVDTATIDPDNVSTEIVDSSGGSDYWYLFVYYNSTALSETSKTNAIRVRGSSYGDYVSVERVRREAGFQNNPYVPDDKIKECVDDAQSEVKGALKMAGYTLPLTTVPPVVRRATMFMAAGYLLMSDFGLGAVGTSKEGATKLEMGRKMLKDFLDMKVELLDNQESGLDQNDNIGLGGYPNNDTDPEPMFTMQQEF